MADNDLIAQLDAATRDHRLLEHPFYQAWVAGTLERDDLAFYSTQYWRQVEAFPGYLSDLAGRLPEGPAREIVETNLSDEVDGDHAGMWLEFAGALGVEDGDVRAADIEPETRSCVEEFVRATSAASLPFALGMLYAYESQTPEVARTKVDGLRRHYDVDGAGVSYFELHADLDVEHSAELRAAIEETVGDERERAEAVAGAGAGARAVYGLLDGVTRARGIECRDGGEV